MKQYLEQLKKLKEPFSQEKFNVLITVLGSEYSIETLEEALKFYKRKEERIRSNELLEWLNDNELDSFESEDFKGTIKTYISAKQIKEKKEELFNWLTERGYQDKIKEVLEFSKGDVTPEILETLNNTGVPFKRIGIVHSSSLKTIVSDRLEANEDIPTPDIADITFFETVKVEEK